MLLELNIGTKASDRYLPTRQSDAEFHTMRVRAGYVLFGTIITHWDYKYAGGTWQDGEIERTERTFVAAGDVALQPHYVMGFIYALSMQLHQDCIAVRWGAYEELVGPFSKSWGKFDERNFLRLVRA